MIRWRAQGRATGCPKGRRTARAVAEPMPDENYDAATRLQRVCGQPSRIDRRGRSNPGMCTEMPRVRAKGFLPQGLRAVRPLRHQSPVEDPVFRATCTLPTVFPSLRAHEPNPAELEIHPDLAGEMLKNNTLAIRTVPGTQETNLRTVQLTNRRMRTFIATPSARNVNNTEDPP